MYASFFRGTPILIQLFLFYYGLPELLKVAHIDVSRVPVLYFVILTYGLHSAAFISEGIRAAVTAVDRGQIEVSYAVGMTGVQAFTRIVFPQALAVAIPILGNVFIGTLKDTSLAFTLGVMELTAKSQSLGQLSRHFIESYIALAAIYFILSFVLEKAFIAIERRLLRHEGRTGATEKVPLGKNGLNAGSRPTSNGTREAREYDTGSVFHLDRVRPNFAGHPDDAVHYDRVHVFRIVHRDDRGVASDL